MLGHMELNGSHEFLAYAGVPNLESSPMVVPGPQVQQPIASYHKPRTSLCLCLCPTLSEVSAANIASLFLLDSVGIVCNHA